MTTPTAFEAWEMHELGRLERASFRFVGDEVGGWRVERNGQLALEVAPGHRLLGVAACGVCATDLARPFLPFPLPQVVGHEIVALDDAGSRHVVEINDSHAARGEASGCAFCAAGLERHCPERMVLGIDRLPGGFGAVILAPVRALLPVPDSLPTRTAVLVEPFAAALNAVETARPRAGETIAVLGPRRLGALVVAALDAWREREGVDFSLLAWVRREGLRELLLGVGADEVEMAPELAAARPQADVVFDTTGNPDALPLALALARREVHLKSTHGRPSGGLGRSTEAVVDELSFAGGEAALADLDGLGTDDGPPLVAWLAAAPPPAFLERLIVGTHSRELLRRVEAGEGAHPLRRADVVVIDDETRLDEVVRPDATREIGLVRPRGRIVLIPGATPAATPIGRALLRGVRLSTSRCGPFAPALALLDADARRRALGEVFVSHVFSREDLPLALATAAAPECVKAVVGDADAR